METLIVYLMESHWYDRMEMHRALKMDPYELKLGIDEETGMCYSVGYSGGYKYGNLYGI